jgi:integrase/recombinase XerD
MFADFLRNWVEFLVKDMFFGPQDALFPKPTMGVVDGEFAVTGLSREIYQGTTQLRDVIGKAFVSAGLPRFHPHGFRETLVALANEVCKTPEEFKAWSQNLGHDSVITTIAAYMPVSPSRQRDLIRGEGRA